MTVIEPLEITEVVGLLRGSMGLLLRRARQTHLMNGELTWAENSALRRLAEDGPATSAELARVEQIRPQSMGQTLAGLADRGLVARDADPHDGRRVLFSLTEAGRQKRLAARDARAEQLGAILAAEFTDAELRQLVAIAPLVERLAWRI